MSWEIIWPWIAFNAFVVAMLAVDLGVFHRKAHEVSLKEAGAWSVVWISLAMLFNVGLYLWKGPEPAFQFLAGYLIEKSLSIDNIFVFVLIFATFAVPAVSQHRVLFWGILGALLMRGAFIALGAALLTKFHWIIYLFGAFLVVTGVKMALMRADSIHPERNPLLRLARKLIPVTSDYHGQSFFVRLDGRLLATPLLLVLLVVESTDLVFAVDSIPAIFAITSDPFLVYTSNVFAILGLRSLYFLLAGVVGKFSYLKLGLSVVLAFVGVKMLLTDVAKVPIGVSLAVIAGVIGLSILASLVRSRRIAARSDVGPAPEP